MSARLECSLGRLMAATVLACSSTMAPGCSTAGGIAGLIGGGGSQEVGVGAAEGTKTTEAAAVSFSRAAEKYRSNDLRGARSAFRDAANADPKLAIARHNIGVLYEKEGNIEEAAKAYREAVDADPTVDAAVNNLGLLLEQSGQVDAAKGL